MSGLLGRPSSAYGLRVGRRQRERTRALRLAGAPLAQASSGRPGGAHLRAGRSQRSDST
jgi:hypothetical protein